MPTSQTHIRIAVTRYRWNGSTMVADPSEFVHAANVHAAADAWSHAHWNRPVDTLSQTFQGETLTVHGPDFPRFDWLQFEPSPQSTEANVYAADFAHLTDDDLAREIAHARNRRDAFAAGREAVAVMARLSHMLAEQSRRRDARQRYYKRVAKRARYYRREMRLDDAIHVAFGMEDDIPAHIDTSSGPSSHEIAHVRYLVVS